MGFFKNLGNGIANAYGLGHKTPQITGEVAGVVPAVSSPHPDFTGSRDVGGSVAASNTADQGKSLYKAIGSAASAVQGGLRKRRNASSPTDTTATVPEDGIGGIDA